MDVTFMLQRYKKNMSLEKIKCNLIHFLTFAHENISYLM